MPPQKIIACCLIVFCSSILSNTSWGWGQRGHETVEEVALKLLPRNSFSELMLHNIDQVKFLAMVPDEEWKHGSKIPHPLEGQAHFFAFDFYSPRGGTIPTSINEFVQRYGHAAVLTNGTAPWRVQQMAVLLVNLLKEPKVPVKEVLTIAAILGHYVGDVGNPLHVSMDWDGQQIGRPGLHSFFETQTVDDMSDAELLPAVYKTAASMLHSIPNNIHPIDGAMGLAREGHVESIPLLAEAKKSGLNSELETAFHPIIIKTLANSTAMLAKIWNEAYVLAGSPVFETGSVGKVDVPKYVELNYISGDSK